VKQVLERRQQAIEGEEPPAPQAEEPPAPQAGPSQEERCQKSISCSNKNGHKGRCNKRLLQMTEGAQKNVRAGLRRRCEAIGRSQQTAIQLDDDESSSDDPGEEERQLGAAQRGVAAMAAAKEGVAATQQVLKGAQEAVHAEAMRALFDAMHMLLDEGEGGGTQAIKSYVCYLVTHATSPTIGIQRFHEAGWRHAALWVLAGPMIYPVPNPAHIMAAFFCHNGVYPIREQADPVITLVRMQLALSALRCVDVLKQTLTGMCERMNVIRGRLPLPDHEFLVGPEDDECRMHYAMGMEISGHPRAPQLCPGSADPTPRRHEDISRSWAKRASDASYEEESQKQAFVPAGNYYADCVKMALQSGNYLDSELCPKDVPADFTGPPSNAKLLTLGVADGAHREVTEEQEKAHKDDIYSPSEILIDRRDPAIILAKLNLNPEPGYEADFAQHVGTLCAALMLVQMTLGAAMAGVESAITKINKKNGPNALTDALQRCVDSYNGGKHDKPGGLLEKFLPRSSFDSFMNKEMSVYEWCKYVCSNDILPNVERNPMKVWDEETEEFVDLFQEYVDAGKLPGHEAPGTAGDTIMDFYKARHQAMYPGSEEEYPGPRRG
jgi:hypothetical protein